ncbi:BREX-2 system phosphatase PglZ [Luteococcus peritonei]|uniref:BREX-2 system phosphatase PglZ n=1 Tax=Luteococcus peritonei TaxID=88874 RepID=A0ABW4RU69_9ACTN
MTGTTGATITPAVIRGEIDKAVSKDYGTRPGDAPVMALRAVPEPSLQQDFTYRVAGREITVKVRPCVSSLAALEALQERGEGTWLVVITDRPDEDLGAGVLAHFIDARVRGIDPWQSAWLIFGAHGVDRSLAHLPNDRAIAEGLIALHHADELQADELQADELPAGGSDETVVADWPAAPAGVLTRDHALGAVARRRLGLPTGTIDGLAVARWTTDEHALARIARLRTEGGDALTSATLTWLAGRTGPAAPVVTAHLREAHLGRLVPLGLVVDLLRKVAARDDAIHAPAARAALERLATTTNPELRTTSIADALGTLSAMVTQDLLDSDAGRATGHRIVLQADEILTGLDADNLAIFSPLLRSGLRARIREFSRHLADPDLTQLELAWLEVTRHSLARGQQLRRDPDLEACHASLRLARWLATDDQPVTTVAQGAKRQLAVDSWVDSALHDAAHGTEDVDAAVALRDLVSRARARRAAHDQQFAEALVLSTASQDGLNGPFPGDGDSVLPLERVVETVVVPQAKQQPVLFLVLDGLSGRVAAELLDELLDRPDGWSEYLLPGHQRRAAAIAVLPTLTTVSRTSLLCGQRMTGSQTTEKQLHPQLVASLGGGHAAIFHKKQLDTSADGYQLASDVTEAVRDVNGTPVVTCVLNTVDDALDRSDPGGMRWASDDIKHLRPLLTAAAAAGRAVIITSDHGHIVERRAGSQLPGITSEGGRVRSTEPPAGQGEVLVDGPRVVGGPKILAVSEVLRYGPLKAGYHGGAAPAEVVVPLVLMAPLGVQLAGCAPAVSQHPDWWDAPLSIQPKAAVAAPVPAPAEQTLFDEVEPVVAQPATLGIGARVVASPVWLAQRQIAGRIVITDDRVAALIDRLAGVPDQRLPAPVVAQTLGVPERSFVGAFAQLQKLLNVEGYAVIRNDAGSVVLDTDILAEQFGV